MRVQTFVVSWVFLVSGLAVSSQAFAKTRRVYSGVQVKGEFASVGWGFDSITHSPLVPGCVQGRVAMSVVDLPELPFSKGVILTRENSSTVTAPREVQVAFSAVSRFRKRVEIQAPFDFGPPRGPECGTGFVQAQDLGGSITIIRKFKVADEYSKAELVKNLTQFRDLHDVFHKTLKRNIKIVDDGFAGSASGTLSEQRWFIEAMVACTAMNQCEELERKSYARAAELDQLYPKVRVREYTPESHEGGVTLEWTYFPYDKTDRRR